MSETRTVQHDQPTDFEELRRLSPKVTGGLLRMRQEAYRDATVAAKYKLLTAMGFQSRSAANPAFERMCRWRATKASRRRN